MCKRHDNPGAFQCEMQNEPEPKNAIGSVSELSSAEIMRRTNTLDRYTVPKETTRLTAFIDIGLGVCWYGVVAWDERFNGSLVDAGPFPKQTREYFAARDARPSLKESYPAGYTDEQLVYAALRDLSGQILGRVYPRQDTGEPVRVGACLIDSNYLTDAVFQFVRESPYGAILYPARGYAKTSNARPMNEWAVKPGERVGPWWRLGTPANGCGRLVTHDPDYWKTFLADRLQTPPGGGGCF
ncbi:MAG: phage terminase large subunit family protein [Planctomycetes bacterium]|nr:phage terminase large subunit family protein [Planctomycetota bacterium]